MKAFAIKDDTVSESRELAYLLYYEMAKMFFIEIPEQTSEWEVPLLLSSFVKRKKYTVDAYWSKKWVQMRIIPPDRQNLGEILRENGLAADTSAITVEEARNSILKALGRGEK